MKEKRRKMNGNKRWKVNIYANGSSLVVKICIELERKMYNNWKGRGKWLQTELLMNLAIGTFSKFFQNQKETKFYKKSENIWVMANDLQWYRAKLGTNSLVRYFVTVSNDR